ncbi:MAG: gliding motility-associated C-terminal domain-containing protein, partial [Bacteroidetes bacterium]|nr:gliding motility-associated C-terminal domain-containing protein [Bacteroidota bacterium]
NITYSTTGATGASFSGLPTGFTGNWLANVITISGTPTASGTFNYTVTLIGGCGTITATGTITVNPNNTVVLSSAVGTNNQTHCINTAITNITYSTTGATGASFSGLPAGVTGNWLANVITISGTPTVSGIFNYTVTLTGGCGTITATGTITVNPVTGATSFTLGAISVCQNAADETYTATAANSTSILYSVLPATAGVINATTGVMNWDASFSGVATITAVSSGLCGSTTNNLIVTVIALPIASASGSSPVCINSSINLTAQTVTGGTYLWAGPNGFTSALQNPVILSATLANSGLYSLTVSVNTCTSTVSNVTIIVKDCPADLSVVKTVDNTHPKVDHNVVFNILASNNGPYDATGVVVNDILQSGYTFVSASTTAGMYNSATGVWVIGYMNIGAIETLVLTARVNSNGSYINTASITGVETDGNLNNNISTVITYPTNFFIPEGFSPNSDGINDVFVITGINNYSSNTFTIFNRWGNKVYEASPYQNNWDGTSSFGLKVGGDELPTGTYFYILDLGNNTDAYKGTIYLNR